MGIFWFYLIVAAFLNGAANLLLKAGANSKTVGIYSQFFSFYFILGILLFGCCVLLYSYSLRFLNLSFAYPFFVGLSMVFITAMSISFYQEKLNIFQLAGIFVVFLGMSLMIYGK